MSNFIVLKSTMPSTALWLRSPAQVFHLVWITKYRYKVLRGPLQSRVRDIVAQVADEMHIKIFNSVVSSDHVHIFCSIPPHIAVSEFVKKAKGRSHRGL